MSDRQEEKYRRILRECHPLITRHCNPDELVGPLSAQHLLTNDQVYTLNNRLLPPLQRLNELMEWLPRKGGNWFERFATALASGKEGIIPTTDGHVTVLKKLWEKAEEANYPLPAHLQVWVSAAEPHDFGNHGDSLLDNPSDFSFGSPGDSLSVEVAIPVEETRLPIQEQHHHGDDNSTSPSMITLDKVSSLLYKALGHNWQRIHNYCYRQDRHFDVAIGAIKQKFRDHPHMQMLMTLKQWTMAQTCSSQLLFDQIKPLLDHSPHYQSQLRELLFSGYHQDIRTVAVPTQQGVKLNKQEVDKISRKMFTQISPAELYRITIYCEISDDTMATLEKQYGDSPVTLLTNMLLYWVNHHDQPTRSNFALILDNLGIPPQSVM